MPTFQELRDERLKKAEKLTSAGFDPYASAFLRKESIGAFLNRFEPAIKETTETGLAGRVRAIRVHGKAMFFDLEDESATIQIFANANETEKFSLFQEVLDSGDIVECKGKAYQSQRGEKSLLVSEWRFLAKSIFPLPSNWFGLKDKEERFRKRYLDLLFNPETKKRFITASKAIREIHASLEKKGFVEVKTPILQALAGGALAKPFQTHLNALDIDLYLRIAPELYLKRLLVGGYEKIYEMGTCFRNEGMDYDHNPEFLMLELYWAYQNWEGLMSFTEEWLYGVAKKLHVALPKPPWKRIAFHTILKEKTGIDYAKASEQDLASFATQKNLTIRRVLSKGKIADEIFKKTIQENLIEPTFITQLPLDISPFAKRLPDDPQKTARFILYIKGLQLVNGFSELNDPQDQASRFQSQQDMKKKGDEEITEYDRDFIEALSYGMPPAAGLGLGIERFLMLLTDAPSLREVILFPLMRPKT